MSGDARERLEGDELRELRQAVWDARAILGFDNDGDPTPDALPFPTLAELVKRDAVEFRKDYDEVCEEAARLRTDARALLERAEADARDAARYRWLKNRCANKTIFESKHQYGPFIAVGSLIGGWSVPIDIDAAIDAAIEGGDAGGSA